MNEADYEANQTKSIQHIREQAVGDIDLNVNTN